MPSDVIFMDGFHVEDKSPQQAFRVRGEILETAAVTIFPITQRFCPQDPCLGGDGQDIMLKMGIETWTGSFCAAIIYTPPAEILEVTPPIPPLRPVSGSMYDIFTVIVSGSRKSSWRSAVF